MLNISHSARIVRLLLTNIQHSGLPLLLESGIVIKKFEKIFCIHLQKKSSIFKQEECFDLSNTGPFLKMEADQI